MEIAALRLSAIAELLLRRMGFSANILPRGAYMHA